MEKVDAPHHEMYPLFEPGETFDQMEERIAKDLILLTQSPGWKGLVNWIDARLRYSYDRLANPDPKNPVAEDQQLKGAIFTMKRIRDLPQRAQKLIDAAKERAKEEAEGEEIDQS